MIGGAGNQEVSGPVPVSAKRDGVKRSTDYFFQFYRCPCNAWPYSQSGIVKVDHQTWCPNKVLQDLVRR